jgi:hypothetical protein
VTTRGWKLPKFYFLKISDDPEEYEVVDGQQRLSAIFDFFSDDLALSDESAEEFKAKVYKDLPLTTSDNFDDFEIEFDVIEDADEKELKEFFQRLQQGLPLTSTEKLNSIHSNLTDYCRELASHPFLSTKIAVRDTRYAHFDIVTKVAAIEIDGLEVGVRYDNLRPVFESQASFSKKSAVAKRLSDTFDYLDKIFPEKNSLLRNRSFLQSLITLTARIVSTGKGAGHEQSLFEFFTKFLTELSHQVELGLNATDSDYIQFQKSITANVRTSPKVRHEILLRKLLAFDPVFFDVLGTSAIAESGLNKRIRDLSESIANLVSAVNEEYSAQNGIDLIKSTNKTTKSLLRLGKMIADFSGYKNLVDDLYFTFHEGAKPRLDENKPISFMDINNLRTDLQHDLDHGGTKRSSAKRIKVGETFKKYAGTNTPTTISPDQFPIIQINLLSAVETDLRKLLMEMGKAP